MVSSKRRKTPVTGTSTKSRPSSTKTRSVIRKFHVLLKSRRKFEGRPSDKRELDAIDEQISSLGGLEAYQGMSKQGQSAERGGGTETVLIDWLKDIVKDNPLVDGQKLRLLEVGALEADNYRGCFSWIENTPIDLNAQDPSIRQQDFRRMSEGENTCKWDVLSLSLVLNFVPDPRERGRMLRLAHLFLGSSRMHSGLLFVTLPLPCVQNSRYLTLSHFEGLMKRVGFEKVKERWRVGGKMGYWLFRKVNPTSLEVATCVYEHKSILRSGKMRNNFAILL
ncbi:nucleolus protein [Thelephora ganbajun]|uniref:Nucleolus protein n=1 Tax=Thelephora ganbajun TaxID=370292 RepID=A0ACB6ZAR9_THEGA|nr:nucleolus protein [Thelephora ganbajun]